MGEIIESYLFYLLIINVFNGMCLVFLCVAAARPYVNQELLKNMRQIKACQISFWYKGITLLTPGRKEAVTETGEDELSDSTGGHSATSPPRPRHNDPWALVPKARRRN